MTTKREESIVRVARLLRDNDVSYLGKTAQECKCSTDLVRAVMTVFAEADLGKFGGKKFQWLKRNDAS